VATRYSVEGVNGGSTFVSMDLIKSLDLWLRQSVFLSRHPRRVPGVCQVTRSSRSARRIRAKTN